MLRSLRLFAPALALAAAACGGTPPGEADGTTAFTVKLKDAPGDFAKAVVTIDRIVLVGTGGQLVLRDQPVTTDLLTLVSTSTDLVSGTVVPSGTYTELRFVISGACIAVERAGGQDLFATTGYDASRCGTGPAGRLQAPSFAQSGLKVKFDADNLVIDGEEKVVIVDFDVRQSFGREAGNSGMWVLRPVIKGADVTSTGTARVDVSLATGFTLPRVKDTTVTLAQFSAVLLRSATDTAAVVPLADANNDGVWSAPFIFTAPGTYQVGLQFPRSLLRSVTTTPVLPASVTVQANQTAVTAISVTAADTVTATP